MTKTLNSLIITLLGIITVSALSAQPLPELNTPNNSLAINIIHEDNERTIGQLIDADESYFVFANSLDESVQVIPREEVSVLETNIGVNLFQVLKSSDTNKLTDKIELEDGSMIPCILLDISTDSIQYFTGESLKRQIIKSENVYMLHLSADSVQIPFPMFSANIAAL